MPINNSIRAEMADELKIALLTGGYDLIGTLAFSPVMLIFDNLSTETIEISNNGTSTWKTFAAGEALVLDMRANHGIADNFTFSQGMPLYAKGTAGANTFSISVIYAKDTS